MNNEIMAFRSAEMLQSERAWTLSNLAAPFVSVIATHRVLNVREFSANIVRMGQKRSTAQLRRDCIARSMGRSVEK